LELYYISEDFEKASCYLDDPKRLDFVNNDDLVLRKFFETIEAVINDSSPSKANESFYNYANEHKTALGSWSFDLFEDWLEITKSISKEDKIKSPRSNVPGALSLSIFQFFSFITGFSFIPEFNFCPVNQIKHYRYNNKG